VVRDRLKVRPGDNVLIAGASGGMGQATMQLAKLAGMKVIGTFREPSEPDRFTWLRGFNDMEARAKGLNDFYFGPVWKAHRDAANACIADSDDVLLLRPARAGADAAATGTSPAACLRPH